MHKIFGLIALCILTACSATQNANQQQVIVSPDGHVELHFTVDDGHPKYAIYYRDEAALQASSLGVKLGADNLADDLQLLQASPVTAVQDHYRLSHGKQIDITYRANERFFTLQNAAQKQLRIRFRVSNNGVAFRYEFLGEGARQVVEEEYTSFQLPLSAKAWLQPVAVAQTGWKNTNPSYEEHYQMGIAVDESSPSPAGWVFPALFKNGEVWLAISEAGMTGNYHASRLQPQSPSGEYKIGYPMAAEVFTNGALKAHATLPFHSPWRIIAVGDLAEISQSTLATDLAEPAVAEMAFAKPGFASWSWALLKDDSVNFDTQIAFIDFAADMGWPYTLVDVNWDRNIGDAKMQELAHYAAQKNVGLILWYNSAGNWNETPYTPKHRLLERDARRKEFAKLQSWGIKGVKIDFFAGDGQSMMAYYNALARDAADFNLMVNYHGSSLPRGLQRTYPNLMTMEAVHGFEMTTFFQESADMAPSHITVLPFTRNLFDPMDYTPTQFGDVPGKDKRTSNGFELALPVLFLTGLQHIAETPDGMAKVPTYVKDVLKHLPLAWDESRLVMGYPGKNVVMARRSGNTWYVAGVNGEAQAQTWQLDLSFLNSAQGTLIGDGDEQYSFARTPVNAQNKTTVEVKGNGGFLMIFKL